MTRRTVSMKHHRASDERPGGDGDMPMCTNESPATFELHRDGRWYPCEYNTQFWEFMPGKSNVDGTLFCMICDGEINRTPG